MKNEKRKQKSLRFSRETQYFGVMSQVTRDMGSWVDVPKAYQFLGTQF